MFGMHWRLVLAKLKVLRMFSLIRSFGREGSNVSSPALVFKVDWYLPVNLLAHARLEAELKKEEALVYWDRVIRSRTI